MQAKLPLRQISHENSVIIEHPRSSPASILAVNKERTENIEEAERLDQQLFQLYNQGNYTEAAQLGERVLVL